MIFLKNPFILWDSTSNCEYLSTICSVNKVKLGKLPLYGVDDTIEGKLAGDILSAASFINIIKENAAALKIDSAEYDDVQLIKVLNKCLLSDDISIRTQAEKVTDIFGNRLALVLLTLRVGEDENRALRSDWNSAHWEYWANVKNIIIVGGIAADELGKRFAMCINRLFALKKVKKAGIILFENSINAGILGCAEILKLNDGCGLLFDMGQTNIKSGIVIKKNGVTQEIKPLDVKPSLYTDTKITDIKEKLRMARLLHENITKTICESYLSAISQGILLSDKITISIANYIVGGRLAINRGGYAKLALLCDNYTEFLERAVSEKLGKDIKIRLIHDGTAMSKCFTDISDSVCISLGTAIGVGFPEIKL